MASPDLLADDRLTLMGLLAETWAAVGARTSAHLASHGLATVEFEVCLRLARSPQGQLRMSDLAAQTTLTSSGATRVVDRLVERGLVTRMSCELDRRLTYTVLSEQGHELLDRVLPGHVDLLETWLVGPLRSADLIAFEAALRAVRDHAAPCSAAPFPTSGGDLAMQPQAVPAGSRSRSQEMSAR